jgi:hypothetical protein
VLIVKIHALWYKMEEGPVKRLMLIRGEEALGLWSVTRIRSIPLPRDILR